MFTAIFIIQLRVTPTARTMTILQPMQKLSMTIRKRKRGGDEHVTTECLFCFMIGSSTAVSAGFTELAPDWFLLVSTTVHVASAVAGPLPISTLISLRYLLSLSQAGITDPPPAFFRTSGRYNQITVY